MHGVIGLLATMLIRILEILFAIGAVGSLVVIILSSIEDARTLRNRDAHDHVVSPAAGFTLAER